MSIDALHVKNPDTLLAESDAAMQQYVIELRKINAEKLNFVAGCLNSDQLVHGSKLLDSMAVTGVMSRVPALFYPVVLKMEEAKRVFATTEDINRYYDLVRIYYTKYIETILNQFSSGVTVELSVLDSLTSCMQWVGSGDKDYLTARINGFRATHDNRDNGGNIYSIVE